MGDLGVLEEAGARDLGITGRGGGGGVSLEGYRAQLSPLYMVN